MATNVVMPQLGESVVEGTIGKWFKQVGDKVEQYESIMEVVTDKVTTEIPSPAAGTLLQITVPEGATVKAGTVLAVIGQPEEQIQPAAAASGAAAEGARESKEEAPVASTVVQEGGRPASVGVQAAQQGAEKKNGGAATRLTPVVARMISEYNITDQELRTIQGTGEGGRISKKDLENYIRTRGQKQAAAEPQLAPWEQPGSGDLFKPTEETIGRVTPRPKAPAAPAAPAPAAALATAARPAQTAGEEVIPLTAVRRSIAEHMVRSKQTAPHVTTVHEADMTRVIEHMKAHQEEFARQGVKLTFTPYFVEAAVHALKQVPLVNATLTDQGIVMKRAVNIGVAVAVEDGLIVPVIKNADEKSLLGLARAVNDLSQRARDKKLTPDEVQGGTFTITNYGVFGSLFGTPIINQPQSAILGVGAIQKRVVVINDAIAIRPMIYIGLTFDHRLLDGATGDRFVNSLKEFLTQYPER